METLINEAHSEYLDDIKLDVVKVGYLLELVAVASCWYKF